ncbi:MAG: MBL fold metallo-hydrolase [Candidatus Yanofskybacteria bacterium]|nr:MBL fold metallo-hydrolase [Candidatus Yanofskybacteria bacterium]
MKSDRNWYRQLGEYRRTKDGRKIRGFIGATMHLIRLCGKNIAVDCGIGFDKSDEIQKQYVPDGNWLNGTRIDLIILTHKHLDHVGALVRLVHHHPEALIFMSAKTFEGARIAIEDSLNIWRKEAENARRNGLPIPEPIFTEEMADAFYNNPNLKVFDAPYWLDPQEDLRGQWPGWEMGFYDAGHDVGAVSTYMLLPNGKYFYLTGDVASHDQENARGVLLPPDNFLGDFFDRPGTMVTEATNGDRRMEKPREQLVEEIGQFAREVDARGGVLLDAVFAGTKAGNDMVMFNNLGYKVVVDGLARDHIRVEVPDIEERLKDGRVFFIEEGKSKDKKELAWKQRAEYVAGLHGFVPIIAPSATLDQGFAASAYAPVILEGEKNAAVFTSHIFDDSTTQRLFNVKRGRTIKMKKFVNGRLEPIRVNVRCDIRHFNRSSHDYQDGLVERVRLARPETLIVHHCPGKESFNAFAERVHSLPPPPKKPIWGLNGRKIFI